MHSNNLAHPCLHVRSRAFASMACVLCRRAVCVRSQDPGVLVYTHTAHMCKPQRVHTPALDKKEKENDLLTCEGQAPSHDREGHETRDSRPLRDAVAGAECCADKGVAGVKCQLPCRAPAFFVHNTLIISMCTNATFDFASAFIAISLKPRISSKRSLFIRR